MDDMVAKVKAFAEADANRGISRVEGGEAPTDEALPPDEQAGIPLPEDEVPPHERTSPLAPPPDVDDEQPEGEDGEDVPPSDTDAGDEDDDAAGGIEGEEDAEAEKGDAGLSDDLIARAVQVGLDPKDYQDERILEALTAHEERRYADAGRRVLEREGADEETKRQPERGRERQPSVPTDDGDVKPLLTVERMESLRRDLGDDVADLMQKLDERGVNAERRARAAEQQATQIRSELTQGTEEAEAEARQVYISWFDKTVDALGDEFAEVLGKGSEADLVARGNKKALEGRRQVLELMAFQDAGMRREGIVPNRDVLFKGALRQLHGDLLIAKARQQGREEVTKEITTYNKKHGGGRPSGTRKRPLTPRQEAEAAVREIREAKGDTGPPVLP